ncbi:MAG TPA: FtsW/RodA/SpoVE family cell cycle protein [Acidimicrobiales bacterium]|nr:FtsW/RodA/SpoVE family cell cycle protein [Acidimicrobiales bacterium]
MATTTVLQARVSPVRRLPTWRSGPKPKRRTELGLLVFASVITVALYVIAEVGAKGKVPPHIGPILAVILGMAVVAHIANRWLAPDANAVVLPLAALLNGIGYVVIVRFTPPAAKQQATWAAIGILCYIGVLLAVRHTRDMDRYRYLLLGVAIALLVSPLVPHLGKPVTTTHLWIGLGPITFQPIEFAKLLLVVFFASYFAENKELLSIPTARVGNRLVLDPRPLVPILLFWAFAMGVIGLEDDVGFAMLIFTMFVVLLWVTTGRWAYILFSIALFGIGAFAAAHLFHQVRTRIDQWLHAAPLSQLGYGYFDFAHGGIGGAGLGTDAYANPFANFHVTTDMIFAGIGDQLGFIGAAAVVIAFVLLVGSGLRIAQVARSDFSRLVAVGLTAVLGFQAFFIMAGVTRLLPFTGITLPFVAYGGSSLVANYALLALLMRVSQEGSSTVTERATGVSLPTDSAFDVAS